MMPREDSNLSVSLQWGTLGDCLYVCIARLNASFGYSMGQVIYLFFEEATLGWFQFQIIFLKSVEHDMQSM